MLVATNICHHESFVATSILLSRQQTGLAAAKDVFDATKIILVAAPANDSGSIRCRSRSRNNSSFRLLFHFFFLQAMEYYEATFTIADEAYGSTFCCCYYRVSWLVLIGTRFVLVCLTRGCRHPERQTSLDS